MAIINKIFHVPVLLKEAIELLNIKPGEWYIDATLGGAGHALEIIKQGGKLLGIDCDKEAIKYAKERLREACPSASWHLKQDNFINLKKIAKEYQLNNFAGILFDLGTSWHQLKTLKRGFSFHSDEPLDMRMDPKLKVTASDLINGLYVRELSELFSKYGEERLALPIAKAIVLERSKQAISSQVLAKLICLIYQKYRVRSNIHPATKVFQALRIAVNDELNNLKIALPQTRELLNKGGRLVVISFHSLEDKIVKNFLQQESKANQMLLINKKPIIPSIEEIKGNPSSRSAKLRCGEKT